MRVSPGLVAMADLEAFSSVLDAVYDAALDSAAWAIAIERTCTFLNCVAGAIGAYDLMQRGGGVRFVWGYDPKYLATMDYYTSINPLLRQSFGLKIGEVGVITDVMPMAEFHKERVYREWAEPQGFCDAMQATLERSPMALAVLGLARHKRHGLIDSETKNRMRLLIPHFRRSFLIGKVIDLGRLDAAVFSDAIDGLAAAVFLVTDTGRLLHANVRGEEMVAAGDPLRVVDGVINAPSPGTQRNLAASFREAGAGEAPREHGIAVPLTASSGERYIAHVLPMTTGRRREAVEGKAAAALFVRRLDMKFPAAVETMAQLYGLTPSETRVVHVILDAGGIGPTAMLLRLTENTVKTHLRHIFAKTATGSQVELVKLAAGLASPLAPRL
jgi:DNA-binding CsgD family transcriptional regulator